MVAVNLSSIFFLQHVAARWVLAANLGNLLTMHLLYMRFGYVRLLGLSHVIWWTPLVFYLISISRSYDNHQTLFWYWLILLILINSVSLLFDYSDVIRYLVSK